VKTYTAPASSADSSSCFPLMPCAALSSFGALTAIVLPSPLRFNRTPNQSVFPTFDALKLACSDQAVPLRTNTYAAPADVSSGASTLPEWPLCTTLIPGTSVSSSSAPAATVFPSSLVATQQPIESCASPSLAFRYACCDQLVPLRVNT
jgi:hypothetical protein